MGKRTVFLNLNCFHKTKSFGKAAFLKDAFGQKVFISFNSNSNFQHLQLAVSPMWPVARGTRAGELWMSRTQRQTPCKNCSPLHNMQLQAWIRKDTVGEGYWSVGWVLGLFLWHAAICAAARPASSSISLKLEVHCTSVLSLSAVEVGSFSNYWLLYMQQRSRNRSWLFLFF